MANYFNQAYYVSQDDLKKVVDFLNKHTIGGGVERINVPQYTGPFTYETTTPDGRTFTNVILANGVEMNAGLLLKWVANWNEMFLVRLLNEQMAMAAANQE